jgi:hypothetical protein
MKWTDNFASKSNAGALFGFGLGTSRTLVCRAVGRTAGGGASSPRKPDIFLRCSFLAGTAGVAATP